jgi:hypothetical protein
MAGIALAGTDWDVINQALTGNFAEVTYVRPVKDFAVQARGDSDIYHKRRSADTKFFTIKAGGFADKKVLLCDADAASASLGFFAAASGSDTLEAYVTF